MATLSNSQGLNNQATTQSIAVTGVSSNTVGITAHSIPSTSAGTSSQWLSTRLKLEPGVVGNMTANLVQTNMNNHNVVNTVPAGSSNVVNAQALTLDCYEDMFKEITKKLYGTEDALALMTDTDMTATTAGSIIYDPEFRTDQSGAITFVNTNGLPPGTIVIQRRISDEKALQTTDVNQLALTTVQTPQPVIEERWFESDTALNWTTSKIARYNPNQKVFRCVDCDFIGFLSRVAEHWLGNHASLRVFQCPRCPYTSAWARCVRMHLTRQHNETTDSALWKENPVLEEVTKFLNTLKTRVEQKADTSSPGEKRYLCQYCSYSTDRRDLFNRHENIHRDEKPFECFVCQKQFNRADHVKKHFTRMHREHTYDINRIRKHIPKPATAVTGTGVSIYQSTKYVKQEPQPQHQIVQIHDPAAGITSEAVIQIQSVSGGNDGMTLQQIPLAYFNTGDVTGQVTTAVVQPGIVGDKKTKGSKPKGQKKKKQGEKMYTCSYCPWQGVDNWCLKRHLNTHIKPFLCALCDYKAARSERLATHVLKVHNKRVCHKCSFLADDPESLAQHVQDSHQNPLVKTGYNCNLCQEYFELRADLEAHAILEHQKVIVQCDLCDFRTTDELSMESHLREKHNLQPGMGAVAAATAAAAAAVIEQPQQMLVSQSHSQVIQNPPEQLTMPALQQPRSIHLSTVQQPPPLLQTETIIKQEEYSTDLHAYHIEEAISTVAGIEAEVEDDSPPDTSCDFCGCEFYEEESARRHQKGHELRRVEAPEPQNSKVISRHYTCSTCSYNSATSRIMMQHQRTHSGFELDCKAVGCSFGTSFENSLKEHVQQEHNDEVIRCPHCAYRMVSLVDFSFHWKIHHSSVCSLCIGVYRTKYGMKEPEIQEFVFRTPYETLDFRKEEDLENPVQYVEMEPLAKRPREELGSVFTSLANYFNHPSINFLPRTVDITVISLKPLVDTISTPRPRRRLWDQKHDRRNTREKVIRYTLRRLISTNKNYSVPLVLTRRGAGRQCFQHECRYGTARYLRLSTFLLHQRRVHRKLRVKCDKCDHWFSYLYKALLHQRKYHQRLPKGLATSSGSFQPHEILQHHNNNNITTRMAFKQE